MSENFSDQCKKIEHSLDDLRSSIQMNKGSADTLRKQIEFAQAVLDKASHDQEVYAKAVEVLTLAQKSIQEGVQTRFENLITFALQHILGDDYRFEMEFGRRGNLQEVNFNVKNKNLSVAFDPMDTSGGGVIDIVSFALRVALIELSKPKAEGPIILDETFKHLSRGHLHACSDLLNSISAKIGRQVIMVSHKSEMVELAETKVEVK